MNIFFMFFSFAPLVTFATWILWREFRDEIISGYGEVRYKVESKKERILIEEEFPLVVELFAILLAGNQSPAIALAHISSRASGKFAEVLRDAVQEVRSGSNFSDALDILSERVKSPMVRRFTDSLMIATERGSPLLEVMNRQVQEVRQEQKSRLLESAGKAEIALMIPVVFLILPVSVLFALWPSYFSLGRSVGF
jgi:tight adherence protein C